MSYAPALMLSMATVLGHSALGGKIYFGGYKVALKSVLERVDFPKSDSPKCQYERFEIQKPKL